MFWLLKSEPGTYSFADLLQEKRAVWDGITNPLALKHLRQMKVGDDLLIYHSGEQKAVVGTAKVSKTAYPDPRQKNEKLVVVEIHGGQPLAKPVTLAQIKADKRFAGWALVRMSRLSVVPTTPEQWKAVMQMGGE
jgi:predicted RNA-binding protein with PUA-like domain